MWKFLVALLLVTPVAAETTLLVTVVEKKTGIPVEDLAAEDFSVTAGKAERRVLACEFTRETADIVLMIDASQIGEAAASLAPDIVDQLGEKEQMAIVAYDTGADLIQDFTSSKGLLRKALSQIRFGNSPSMMDAIYAAAADGFEGASFRKAILLVTSGVDGPNRVSVKEVIEVARRNSVSIYPVYMIGYGRKQLENLARATGGAAFNLREMTKGMNESPAARILAVIRGHYNLTVDGNLPAGDKARVEVKGKRGKKALVSHLETH